MVLYQLSYTRIFASDYMAEYRKIKGPFVVSLVGRGWRSTALMLLPGLGQQPQCFLVIQLGKVVVKLSHRPEILGRQQTEKGIAVSAHLAEPVRGAHGYGDDQFGRLFRPGHMAGRDHRRTGRYAVIRQDHAAPCQLRWRTDAAIEFLTASDFRQLLLHGGMDILLVNLQACHQRRIEDHLAVFPYGTDSQFGLSRCGKFSGQDNIQFRRQFVGQHRTDHQPAPGNGQHHRVAPAPFFQFRRQLPTCIEPILKHAGPSRWLAYPVYWKPTSVCAQLACQASRSACFTDLEVIVSENRGKAMSQSLGTTASYRGMVLEQPGQPLRMREWPLRPPAAHEVRIRVLACAVCRTDLHVVDGELPRLQLPVIPGHEIIGVIDAVGPQDQAVGRTQSASAHAANSASNTAAVPCKLGQRVGVPWLGWTCGQCDYCRRGQENLCDQAQFTGYTRPGGYAEYVYADPRYIFPVPENYTPAEAAPLMCAGLIGYRSYRLAGDAKRLGIYGFGAAAHLLVQLARYEGREVFALTRPGDEAAQQFARQLGAVWAGDSDKPPPVPLDAAIIFAPVGALVPRALQAVRKGGVVVCGGIHMSDIPSFPYRLLWEERVLRSVANLTRRDAEEFLTLAPKVPIRTQVRTYPLEQANEALADLRAGRLTGAAVLIP